MIETAFRSLVDTKASTFYGDILEKSENIIILHNFQRYTNEKQHFVQDQVSKKDFKKDGSLYCFMKQELYSRILE